MVRFVVFLSIISLLLLSSLAAPLSSEGDVIEDVNDQIEQTLSQILDSNTGDAEFEDDRKKRETSSIEGDGNDENSEENDEDSPDEVRKKRSIFDEISSIGNLDDNAPTSIQLANEAKNDDVEENSDDDDNDDDKDDENDDRRKRDVDSQIEEEDEDEDDQLLSRKRRDTETEDSDDEENDDDDDDDENIVSIRRKRDTGISDDNESNEDKPIANVKVAPVDASGHALITRKVRDVSSSADSDDNDDDDEEDDEDEDEDDDGNDKSSVRKKRDAESNEKSTAENKPTHSVDDDLIESEKERTRRDLSTKKDNENEDDDSEEDDDQDDDDDADDDDSKIVRRKRDVGDDSDNEEYDNDDDDDDDSSERRRREAIDELIGFDDGDDDDEGDTIRVRRKAPVKPTSTAPSSSNTTAPTASPSSDSALQALLKKSDATPFTASSSNGDDDDEDDDDDDDDDNADDDDDDDDENDDDNDNDDKSSDKKKELEKELRSLVTGMSKQKREAPGYAPRYTDADDLQENDFLIEKPQPNRNNTQRHTHIYVDEKSDFSIDGNSQKSSSNTIDVHPHAPELTERTSSNDVSLATTKHMGGEPSGPIAVKRSLDQRYSTFFTENAKSRVPWVEPKMMKNCWAQSMLASRFGYSPSCNNDGSFSPKQCFLERCWCVHKDGSPQDSNINTRFVYSTAAIMMECAQNP
ncbi:protein starmaker-like isoform X1 [Argopecten irradians]|uniref:protein starmaker-like isoform X1 n=1 Tax=Argopecten irradians TaxID=31199 RepID=UPI0037173641